MGLIDKYLQMRHIDAASDSIDGQTKDAKKENDTIGAMHDKLTEIEKMLKENLLNKKQAEKQEINAVEQTEKQTAEKYSEDKK